MTRPVDESTGSHAGTEFSREVRPTFHPVCRETCGEISFETAPNLVGSHSGPVHGTCGGPGGTPGGAGLEGYARAGGEQAGPECPGQACATPEDEEETPPACAAAPGSLAGVRQWLVARLPFGCGRASNAAGGSRRSVCRHPTTALGGTPDLPSSFWMGEMNGSRLDASLTGEPKADS